MAKKKPLFGVLSDATAGVMPQIRGFASKPPDTWQIAVRGNLDYRQHHPAWYHAIHCITETELLHGIKTLNSTTRDSGLMQFNAGPFLIDAVPDRWMIETNSEANCDRLIEVASTVFDKLSEVALTAFGIHRNFVLEIRNGNAKQFLADQLVGSKLRLRKGDSEAQISYFEHNGDTDTQLWFLAFEQWLNIVHNIHHPIRAAEPGKELEYLDLGKLLRQHAKFDWQTAATYGLEVAKAVAEED